MSAAFARQLQEATRQIEQLQELTASLMRAMRAADERIKQLESKRGPGRPPNEPRRSD